MSVIGSKISLSNAYSLLELMVVVVILSIFSAGVVWVDSALISTTKSARDSERNSDTKSIALLFEQYYRNSPTAAGSSYPTTDDIGNSSTLSSLVPDQEILTPPSLSTPVFTAATNNEAQTPTVDEYIYQPLNAFDNLCTSTPPCVRFVIYHRTEETDEVITTESRHQQ